MTLQSDRPDKAFNVWHSSYSVVKGLMFSSFHRITSGGNWIHLNHNSNNYMSVNAIFNWTNNSSPVSNMPLTVYMEKGRPSVLRIPVNDSDGDIVRCRNPLYWKCYRTICTYFPYGVLDEVRLAWFWVNQTARKPQWINYIALLRYGTKPTLCRFYKIIG